MRRERKIGVPWFLRSLKHTCFVPASEFLPCFVWCQKLKRANAFSDIVSDIQLGAIMAGNVRIGGTSLRNPSGSWNLLA